MKKSALTTLFRLALAAFAVFGLIGSTERSASCAECEADNLAGIKKAFVAFDEQCRQHTAAGAKTCFAASVYNKVLPIMKALGKDNRFGPGDRIFSIGEALTGTLTAGPAKTYQTAAPLDKDSVTVKVTKVDGGNAAVFRICAVSEDGLLKSVGTIEFGRNGEAGEKSTTLSGVRGKILRLDVSSSGAPAAKKFQYRLTTN